MTEMASVLSRIFGRRNTTAYKQSKPRLKQYYDYIVDVGNEAHLFLTKKEAKLYSALLGVSYYRFETREYMCQKFGLHYDGRDYRWGPKVKVIRHYNSEVKKW